MEEYTPTYKTNSGLRCFLEENNTFPSVSLGVFVKSGARYETDHFGIAHFIEHMVFKETQKRSAFEISNLIESVGGEINAYTSTEYSLFYVKMLSKDIELGFDVLSDILKHPTFNAELLEKEREVILEEIFEYYDDPQDICQSEALNSIFGDSSVSRNPLGSEESVRTITRNDLVEYFNKFFVKDNIFISGFGDIDRDAFEGLVEKYFGDFNDKPLSFELDPPSYKFLELNRLKDITQLHLAVTFKGEKNFTHEGYLQSIFTTVLGGNMSSRLFQKLREKNGLAYTVYAYPVRFMDAGGTIIYTSTLPKYGNAAKDMILEEINLIKENGLTDKEFANAKNYLLGSFVLGLENSSARMQKNGVSGLFQGNVRSIDSVIKEIESITKDELEHYIKNLIDGQFGFVKVGKINE